jgi:alpha-1,2-glucosyltransferase
MSKSENEKESSSWLLWLSTGVYVAVSAFLFTLINSEQPQPYMDEIFHIPQAKKYCKGKFTEVSLINLPSLDLNTRP